MLLGGETPVTDKTELFPDRGSELYKSYGIRPTLPVRTKVEGLHLVYRLSVSQIAELLGISISVVRDEIEELREDWKRLGKPLSLDEREMERGRMIAGLDRLIQQIDDQIISSGDGSKLLTLKMNAMDRQAKLRGLEYDKRQQAVDEEESEANIFGAVEEQIKSLPSERLEDMMARLEEDPTQSSSGDRVESSSPSPEIALSEAKAMLPPEPESSSPSPVPESPSPPSSPSSWDLD
jgi:predicted DNA-binding protein YlxM (UPF0122 family)